MSLSTNHITVVLTSQNQGRLLNPSVRSVEAAIQRAESELAIDVEWIITTDSLSPETEEYFNCHLPTRVRKLIVLNGNTAAVINQAVKEATGQFVAIVGGHDLVSSNWLSKSYRECTSRSANVVYHPGMVVAFGDRQFVFITPDQEHPDFSTDLLFSRNLWPGISFALRDIFLVHPFVQPDKASGFGHIYWHWVCDSVAGGVLHKAMKDTFSCCNVSQEHACIFPEDDKALLMPPSKLFVLAYV